MTFQQKLDAIVTKQNSLVCVGLDSEMTKLPAVVKSDAHPQFAFNKAIIDATHELVCAYKPNSAFYEARGTEGIVELKMTCDYLREKYPDIPIILDAKRADIGSTNEGYVAFAFDWLGVDAITLQPYLGKDAILPFLNRKEKGCIILCRTSNPGAGEFQDLLAFDSGFTPSVHPEGNQSVKIYQHVARKVVKEWNANGNCLLVVGATYPEELAAVRKIAGDMTFLVPGVGAQGGDIEKTVRAGLNSTKSGMIINSSRGIIFASTGVNYAEKAREETLKLRDDINRYRI